MIKKNIKSNKGFTILELIIATTIFSIMLLLASAGIVAIGKIYYKGITTSRTQEASRAIVDNIFQNFQTGKSNTLAYSFAAPDPDNPVFPTEGSICIGPMRYTYSIGRQINAENAHALWVDRIRGTACTQPSLNAATPADAETDTSAEGRFAQKELLAENMRLANFQVMSVPGTSLYTVQIRVIYGALDLSPDNEFCLPTSQGGEFCAVSSINTFVKTRLE